MSRMSFGFDKYLIEFPKDLKHTTYDHGYCIGIIFEDNEAYYELIHNKQIDWCRIYIRRKTDKTGCWNISTEWYDIPFNEKTWALLPKGVEVIKYEPV